MNIQATEEKMKQMRLLGMVRAFRTCLETRQAENYTPDEMISYLIEAEWEDRQQRKIQRYLTTARFRYPASLEAVDFQHPRNLDKNQLLRLTTCQYIGKKENLLITGPTGVGKSYIASALGHQACQQGYKVLYFNTAKLFARLKMSKADGSYLKEMNRLEKQDLLILDDFALQPLDASSRLMLLEIMEDRHGRRSTLITSQLPVSKWYEILEEPTIADAILDRLVHTSHRLELKGESLRKKQREKEG
jgi:DNA replication protein DnaC